jgi:hypothetical protein
MIVPTVSGAVATYATTQLDAAEQLAFSPALQMKTSIVYRAFLHRDAWIIAFLAGSSATSAFTTGTFYLNILPLFGCSRLTNPPPF